MSYSPKVREDLVKKLYQLNVQFELILSFIIYSFVHFY